eukprot:1687207-Rhodomonas_salina.2
MLDNSSEHARREQSTDTAPCHTLPHHVVSSGCFYSVQIKRKTVAVDSKYTTLSCGSLLSRLVAAVAEQNHSILVGCLRIRAAALADLDVEALDVEAPE